ncbi:hypothetical protein TSTA_109150 [Talaromyces stipitatus ATCC 10500]|uniref:Uncharacterized protein n=1 Tax=Talaromyces stipitatus (strain ATCC 10500 / CBS 375.48 / QM 6759 / NRRL 1006) TaxID=441959 RepID=B8MUW8_TALSN|nr:uncharacterized protein TSTA_109150 [Talaromyces stipitatus ATCC 10500]EED11736.1 hypothetical protein TSTA_109150 [Talaromyces stipitatus ATCC 10500]
MTFLRNYGIFEFKPLLRELFTTVGKIEEFGHIILISSPTTKSISPPSTVTALRRYINKIEESIEGINDILEKSKPDLVRRIKVVNSSSLAMAGLGELHREDFVRLHDTAKRKNNKKNKRQVKASGAL